MEVSFGPVLRARSRAIAVDALRGIVMIVMVLDHVREFVSASATVFQPDDLTRTNAALFFTRWITHFCAPIFMLTAGIGAFFWLQRGGTRGRLSRFLVTRGLWLVVLELTAIRLALSFGKGPVILEGLWALGWSMVILGALIHLPVRALAVLSIATICLHNFLDPISDGRVWNILHQPGLVRLGDVVVLVAYPLVPWFAVMAAGYCFGRVMTLDAARRRWLLPRIGMGVTLAFLVVRGLNVYGDPQRWSTAIPGMVVLSFLRCTKYPPSLDFLLMTLGPAILLLWRLDAVELSDRNPLLVFGRVPLFYFLVHLSLIHVVAALLDRSQHGYGLGTVYLMWVAVVAAMYPVSLWFGGLKRRRRDWWLSYL